MPAPALGWLRRATHAATPTCSKIHAGQDTHEQKAAEQEDTVFSFMMSGASNASSAACSSDFTHPVPAKRCESVACALWQTPFGAHVALWHARRQAKCNAQSSTDAGRTAARPSGYDFQQQDDITRHSCLHLNAPGTTLAGSLTNSNFQQLTCKTEEF